MIRWKWRVRRVSPLRHLALADIKLQKNFLDKKLVQY